MPEWFARGRPIVATTDPRPRIMGILNVTPDSFSDGGTAFAFDEAVARAQSLIAEGADILDIGGESSRPGASLVSVKEEIRRVLPLVEALNASAAVPLSIDTTKPEVARRALSAGASIVNDISALADPELAKVVADSDAGVVLMHMQGNPQTMQLDPRYDDVVIEVYEALARRIEAAEAIGIERARIAIDPGIGFGKTFDHNLALLRNLGRFATLGCVVLVGISRKGLLKTITGRPITERATASVVASLASTVDGAQVVRVHDVGAMADALKVWEAVKGWPNSC